MERQASLVRARVLSSAHKLTSLAETYEVCLMCLFSPYEGDAKDGSVMNGVSRHLCFEPSFPYALPVRTIFVSSSLFVTPASNVILHV